MPVEPLTGTASRACSASDPATIDVLIAHPDTARRTAMRYLLEQPPYVRVVAVTGDAATAAAEADRLRPAVILIDDRMAARGGVEALSRYSRVILLTAATEPHVVASLLHEPALGYLVYDNFDPIDLVGAVRAVARGLAWLSPIVASAAAKVMREAVNRPGPVERDPGPRLTRRERQVLDLLGKGLSNAAIADTLTVTEKTVRNHLSRGFAKIGVRGRAEAMRHLAAARA
ncbi:response regulator transcription factor [Actinoplanes sp. NPDC051851]|uniref:response regulator transcription factor n=1 Tax=Actinoplanes sp. NPDC051851 TaxID=3154753 RepID=UPI00343F2846